MKKKLKYTLLLLLFLCCTMVSAQSYKKDSLQIKVYTEIQYKSGKPTDISLRKVLCDYCSKNQIQMLGEDAMRRTDTEKQDPKNKLRNGRKRVAVYIRIAKSDFAEIK